MEMAKDVKEILITMKETWSPEEHALLTSLQAKHDEYLEEMDKFSSDVSKLALSMSPEARVLAHELRIKIYQNWRSVLMKVAFPNSPDETAAALEDNGHNPGCDCAACELRQSLAQYKSVMEDFIRRSPKIKRKVLEPDDPDTDDSDGFDFPDFLGAGPS